mgnify:FL=1
MTTTQTTSLLGRTDAFDDAGSAATSLLLAVRLITGYWFLHAGWTKFTFVAGEPFDASGYLANADSPIAWLFGYVAETPWLLEFTNFMIPLGEFLIGLGVLLGALTRLAAFFGGFLMVLFYLGNADWAHGYVNGDLMGLLLFAIVAVFAAGRVVGVDGFIEDTEFVSQRPWLRYILG